MLEFLLSPIFGSLVGHGFAYFTKKEDRKAKEAEYKHEENMQNILARNKREELTLQGEIDEKRLDGEAFLKSQTGGSKMDTARAIVRPVVTAYMLILTTYIGYKINELVGGIESLPEEQIILLFGDYINSVIFLTVMSASFWFGQRGTKSQIKLRGVDNG